MSEETTPAHRTPASVTTSLLLPLLVVAISSLTAYLIAERAVESAREQQAQEFEVHRHDEARAKRAEVYEHFLDAANAFAVAARRAIAECGLNCSSPSAEYQNARYEFQGAINTMYIYGSSQALRESRAIAATLPPSLVGLSGEVRIEPVSDAAFRKAYQEFQTVMCREVPPKPRPAC